MRGVSALSDCHRLLERTLEDCKVLAAASNAKAPGETEVMAWVSAFESQCRGVLADLVGLATRLRDYNVICNASYGQKIRMVPHYGIERADIDHTLRAVREILVGVPVGAR